VDNKSNYFTNEDKSNGKRLDGLKIAIMIDLGHIEAAKNLLEQYENDENFTDKE
jgi:hypothetical protein